MPLEFVQTRIYLPIIQRLTALTDTLEQERLRVDVRIHTENVEHDPWGRTIITRTDDVPVTDDENELALIVVVEGGEGVDSTPERVFAFGVTGDLGQDELVLEFRGGLRSELQGGEDCMGSSASVFNDDKRKERRTLQRHTTHHDNREDNKQVILHLTPRRIPKLHLTPEERVPQTIHIQLHRIRVLSIEDLLQGDRDILPRALTEDGDDVLVEELVWTRVQIVGEREDVVGEIVDLLVVDGPDPRGER